MGHIEIKKIHLYLEDQLKGEEAMATASHLATCERCFKVLLGLKDIEKVMKSAIKAASATKDCPEDWEIAAFIRNEPADKVSIQEHLNSCDFCIDRAAVYYKAEGAEIGIKTPDEWKNKAVTTILGENVEKSTSSGHNVLKFLRKISKPRAVFSGFALAAAAMVALFIWVAMPENTRVIAIRSSEKLAFKESGSPSSFGFMGRERIEKSGGMEISKKGENIFWGWKEIPGAMEYSLSVINKSSGEAIISGLSAKEPKVAIPAKLLKKDELYAWAIKGFNKDGEEFEYTGEFLLTK